MAKSKDMIAAVVALLNAMSAEDRNAVLLKFSVSPNKTPSPPSLIGLGRAGSSSMIRSELIDYCKRIEHCYRQSPHHPIGKPPFIPFKRTEELAESILERHGEQILKSYVNDLERSFQNNWPGFGRPERMQQHFDAWFSEQQQKSQPNPSQ